MSKQHMTVQEVLAELKARESSRDREGMARFGINLYLLLVTPLVIFTVEGD